MFWTFPILWNDSRRQLSRWIQRIGLGLDPGTPAATSASGLVLLGYAISSISYRLIVTVSIFFVVYQWLEPLDMALVAKVFLCYAMVGMVASPIYQAQKMIRHPAVRRSFKPSRMIATASLVTIGLRSQSLSCRCLVDYPPQRWSNPRMRDAFTFPCPGIS